MVCQVNYGTPEDTEVENFLCLRCNGYAARGSLIRRIELFEEQREKYNGPLVRNVDVPDFEGQKKMKSENLRQILTDPDVQPTCEDCNDEHSIANWFVSDENGNLIAGPKCDACYFEYHKANNLDFNDEEGGI
jgi:hypothetical protein